jgi:hypothetical protein
MPNIFYSSVIPASIDRIWAIIRDFKELPSWNPIFSDCFIEEGRPGDAVGSVMSLHLKSGGHLRERLLAHSDRDHICTYTILESPLPLTDYIATIQLLPVTDTNQTYAQWRSEFNCSQDVELDMMNTVRGVYQAGFDFLKTRFTT